MNSVHYYKKIFKVKCTNCNHVFNSNEFVIDTEPHHNDASYIIGYYACPNCGSKWYTPKDNYKFTTIKEEEKK